MQSSRTSPFLRPRFAVPGSTDATVGDDAPDNTVNGYKQSLRCAPKSGSQILSPDIPLWATVEGPPDRRSRATAREQFDQGGGPGGRSDAAVFREQLSRSKQLVAIGRASCPKPLLTVGETATTLDVSVRTDRRLIASGAIPAVSIGRSVRLRPSDVARGRRHRRSLPRR